MYDLSVLGQLMDQTMTEYQLRKALRTKKWAEITPRGRLHFHKLVLDPVAINKQVRLVFQIKRNFLHLLRAPEQRRVLQDFQRFSHFQLENLQTMRDDLMINPRMAPFDVADAIQLNYLQQLRAQAQANWIAARLKKLH